MTGAFLSSASTTATSRRYCTARTAIPCWQVLLVLDSCRHQLCTGALPLPCVLLQPVCFPLLLIAVLPPLPIPTTSLLCSNCFPPPTDAGHCAPDARGCERGYLLDLSQHCRPRRRHGPRVPRRPLGGGAPRLPRALPAGERQWAHLGSLVAVGAPRTGLGIRELLRSEPCIPLLSRLSFFRAGRFPHLSHTCLPAPPSPPVPSLLLQAEQAATGKQTIGSFPAWSPAAIRGFVGISGAYDLKALSERLHRRGLNRWGCEHCIFHICGGARLLI